MRPHALPVGAWVSRGAVLASAVVGLCGGGPSACRAGAGACVWGHSGGWPRNMWGTKERTQTITTSPPIAWRNTARVPPRPSASLGGCERHAPRRRATNMGDQTSAPLWTCRHGDVQAGKKKATTAGHHPTRLGSRHTAHIRGRHRERAHQLLHGRSSHPGRRGPVNAPTVHDVPALACSPR